ncbi:unnamed protein product [Cercospora beticola]|nr:unnamed protein product [Cercospora beticola]
MATAARDQASDGDSYMLLTKPYSEQFVTVNETSHLFHVDRASRKKFAQSYYGNPGSIFILCRNWIPEDKTHLKLIKDLRLGVPVPTTSSPLGIGWAGWMMECTEVFEGSITFMNGETIETLLKERAGIANSPCA